MKFLWMIAGVAILVGLGVLLDRQSRVVVDRPEPLVERHVVWAVGRIEGATEEIELRPQLFGHVSEVPVREGQTVAKGDLLLQLDDAQHRSEVAAAAAELELAKAQLAHRKSGARRQEREEAKALHRAKQSELERAKLSWKRISELQAAKAVSEQDADNQRTLVAGLEAAVEAAKARLELIEAPPRPEEIRIDEARIQAAQAKLDLANVLLKRCSLRAPIGGQILKIDAEAGELAGPNSDRAAMVLADTSRFRVRAFVEELDAPQVQPGMTAVVTADGLPDREFQGRVVHYSPRMERKELWSSQPTERYDTKTREVWIELDETGPFVVGLRVEARIDLKPEKP